MHTLPPCAINSNIKNENKATAEPQPIATYILYYFILINKRFYLPEPDKLNVPGPGRKEEVASCCHWWWACCCCHCSGSFYLDNVVSHAPLLHSVFQSPGMDSPSNIACLVINYPQQLPPFTIFSPIYDLVQRPNFEIL